MRYYLTFSKGIAGKISKTAIIEEWEKPRHGFYWFFYFPSLRTNGGKFSRGDIVDINFHWLMFWLSVTFWPVRREGEYS